MDYSTIQDQVQKLHEKAVLHSEIRYQGNTYNLNFVQGVYIVTHNEKELIRLNTRKITQAKKWLKAFLDN